MKPKNPPIEQHCDITVWNAEDWYSEDIQVRDMMRSIQRTISEGESMTFNTLVLDIHPYMADVCVFSDT